MHVRGTYVLLLAVLLLSATAVADWSPLDDPVADPEAADADANPVSAAATAAAAMMEEMVAVGTWLEQLDQADGNMTAVTAVIARAKEAKLPEAEMEQVRRAAQRVILGAHGKTKEITQASKDLAVVMRSHGVSLAEKGAAIELAESKGVNAKNTMLFTEWIRQHHEAKRVEKHAAAEAEELVARWQAKEDAAAAELAADPVEMVLSSLEEQLGVERPTQSTVLLTVLVPVLLAVLVAALKHLFKPSQAQLQRELLAEEEKAMSKKGRKAAAEARRKRDAMRVKSSSQFKSASEKRTDDRWKPARDDEVSNEYNKSHEEQPVGQLLVTEGAFQVVQKAQKVQKKKRDKAGAEAKNGGKNGGRTPASASFAAGFAAGKKKAAEAGAGANKSVPGARGGQTDSKERKPSGGGDKERKPNGGGDRKPNGGGDRKPRGSGSAGGGRGSAGGERSGGGGGGGGGGGSAEPKRGKESGSANGKRGSKGGGKGRKGKAAAEPAAHTANAWFKDGKPLAPVPMRAPEPASSPPQSPPAPAPAERMPQSPMASAASTLAGWLPRAFSVGSNVSEKTESDEETSRTSSPNWSDGMPSPVPRLAFAGLPPPTLKLDTRVDDETPPSAAGIRFGAFGSPTSAAASQKGDAEKSCVSGRDKSPSAADEDDDWRASSAPLRSPGSAAAAAAAKMLGGWAASGMAAEAIPAGGDGGDSGDSGDSSGGSAPTQYRIDLGAARAARGRSVSGGARGQSRSPTGEMGDVPFGKPPPGRRSPAASAGDPFAKPPTGRRSPSAAMRRSNSEVSMDGGSNSMLSSGDAEPTGRPPRMRSSGSTPTSASKGKEPDWNTLRNHQENRATTPRAADVADGDWTKVEGLGSARSANNPGSARSNASGRSSPMTLDDLDKLGGARGWADYTPPSSAGQDRNRNPWGDH